MGYWDQVFNFKLVCFAAVKELHGANAQTSLKLKTRPWFCPAAWTNFSLQDKIWAGFSTIDVGAHPHRLIHAHL
jgi:hypothetical protein